MPQHVIVDGSNLATEGRTLPSLKQLNEAIASYREDHPDVLITVVVDATFGHRIDTAEGAEFERAIETNAFVAPPAGAVGRGDGFILSIAQKANASILSNDSYQEFHGEYAWLFDEGRLIGGKPVPHVGWVFVNRVPVRGPISRRSVKEQKVVDKAPGRSSGRRGVRSAASSDTPPAISADGPMPVPKLPPPGATLAGSRRGRGTKAEVEPAASAEVEGRSPEPSTGPPATSRTSNRRGAANNEPRQPVTPPKSVNDLLAFLSFVEHFPVGTAVTAIVETYSSHGAYVAIGDAKGYVPLRLMADPAPRSAREVMAIGETVTLVVASFGPARRSIDLAIPAMAPPAPLAVVPKARRVTNKAAAVTEASPPKSVASKSAASKPAASKSVASKPAGSKSAASKSTAVKSTAVKSTASKSTAAKAAASKSTPSKPNPSKPTASKSNGQKSPGASLRQRGTKASADTSTPTTFDTVFADDPPLTAVPAPKSSASSRRTGAPGASATSAPPLAAMSDADQADAKPAERRAGKKSSTARTGKTAGS